jgi:hypothetical protein
MKSYHNDIRNEYYRDNFFAIDLLELQLISSAGTNIPRYYNNGGMNIVAPSTLTGSNVTYTAQGEFMAFSAMTEELDVTVGKFNISMSGIWSPTDDLIEDLLDSPSEGRRVIIKKAFLNTSTMKLVQNPITIYNGYIYNYAITEGAKSCSITLSCSSLFSDFERTAGRKTNNWSNWLFQGSQYDKAMDKSGYVGESEFLWGRLAK